MKYFKLQGLLVCLVLYCCVSEMTNGQIQGVKCNSVHYSDHCSNKGRLTFNG